MPDQQSALSEWKRNLKEEIPELQNLGSFLVTKANVHEERKFKFLKTLEAPALRASQKWRGRGGWGGAGIQNQPRWVHSRLGLQSPSRASEDFSLGSLHTSRDGASKERESSFYHGKACLLTVKILNITQIIDYFSVCFSGEQLSWFRVSAAMGCSLLSMLSRVHQVPLKTMLPVWEHCVGCAPARAES